MRITVAAPFSCSRSDRPLAAKEASCFRHVDRQEVIAAFDGEAVTGEIDERGVAALDLVLELDERTADGAVPDILR